MTDSEKIGIRLKVIRLESRLKTDDVAKAINVNRECISKLEQGLYEQPLNLVGRLAKLYGVSVDYIASAIDKKGARRDL